MSRRISASRFLGLASVLVLAVLSIGCGRKERVAEVKGPGIDIKVDRDKTDGSVDVKVDKD